MLYTTITIDDIDYKLRLTAAGCCDLEEKLGQNPLNIFMFGSPKLSQLLEVFYFSLQPFHKVSREQVNVLYDTYVEQGGSFTDFMKVIMQLLKDSGFIRQDEESKNA